MTYTREDYLNKKCSHEEYYQQFVTDQSIYLVLSMFDNETIKEAYLIDKHLNNLPLEKWDFLADYLNTKNTLAEKVCILKQSARHIISTSEGTT